MIRLGFWKTGFSRISPTNQTISDGTFPYVTSYYAVVRKSDPEGSPGRQLIDWFLTSEGQQTASGKNVAIGHGDGRYRPSRPPRTRLSGRQSCRHCHQQRHRRLHETPKRSLQKSMFTPLL